MRIATIQQYAVFTEFWHSCRSKASILVGLLREMFTLLQSTVNQCDQYFARQLLNKHVKNYQNVEKITKFLLSTKEVWKSIKHLSKTKSVKRFPSLKLCFFHVFLSHLYFLVAIVQNASMTPQWLGPDPGSLARNQHRPQGEWWSAGFPRFSWTAWARSLQFGCTALQAWTCNCSHWIFE
jgi:hypothetical protein